jgi:hypothetical protein
VRTTSAPYDHVVIFDEAQRAWTQRKTTDFMKRRKKIANFNRSEPACRAHIAVDTADNESDPVTITRGV